MKKVLLLLFFCSNLIRLTAHERDSLLWRLSFVSDSSRLDALVALSQWYSQENPDSALELAQQAVAEAGRLPYLPRLAKAHANLGLQLKKQKSFAAANAQYSLAILLYRRLGEKDREAAMLANMGNVYRSTGQYDSALYVHLKGLALREQMGNAAEIANSQLNLAKLYVDLKDYAKALKQQQIALKNFEKAGKADKIADAQSDIGLSYYMLSETEVALKYFQLAENGYRKIEDKEGLAFVFNNQAMVYQQLGQYDKATAFYRQSLEIKKELQDEWGIIRSLFNVGRNYFDQGQYDRAIVALHEAQTKALAENYRAALVEIYDVLSKTYEAKSAFKQALSYRNAQTALSDSLLNEGMTEQMAEMQTRYETEKATRELEKQAALFEVEAAKSEQNRQQRNFLAVFLVTLILLGWLFYGRLRYKQQLKIEQVKREQQEAGHRSILETEEKERIRISRELHDGIGQQLAALKLNLGLFSDNILVDSLHREKLNDLVALTADLSKEIRTVAHSLMPNALLRAGLATAAREFLQQLSSERIKIDFEVIGLNDRLSHLQELTLFRIIQESMSNILKHAEATQVSIQLIRHEQEINLLIEDNGKGFTPSIALVQSGLGLKNIQNRLKEVGGEVDFDSQPGRGTTVNVRLPL